MPIESSHDPRNHLVRTKYFSIRPKPLEQWLWSQGIPASAERVFWLHWQEGQRSGDWCSQLSLRKVATECHLDVSTVTRAYQLLMRLGCLRRTDPGRDAANPFCQATAITEVRVPRELLVEMNRFPSRKAVRSSEEGAPRSPVPTTDEGRVESPALPADPFEGFSGRRRIQAIQKLTLPMSPAERYAFQEAMRTRTTHIAFDADTRMAPESRGMVLTLLARLAAQPAANGTVSRMPPGAPSAGEPKRRQVSVFEVARLRREIQQAVGTQEVPEVTRQVLWSVEEGALRRFSPLHAIHIALKKIREGAWTRPNRMPPNWLPVASRIAAPEACRGA